MSKIKTNNTFKGGIPRDIRGKKLKVTEIDEDLGIIEELIDKKLYEILVPTIRNDGRPIREKFHRVWDAKVYEITGGLTVLKPTKGKWVSAEEKLFEERMIPVRIACTKNQMDKIIDMTIDYYEQLAVMAYKISDEVIIRNKK